MSLNGLDMMTMREGGTSILARRINVEMGGLKEEFSRTNPKVP
jgi:hypothetical protein